MPDSSNEAKREILQQRHKRKLKEVEARENQIDLTLNEGDKIILEEKAKIIWAEIDEIENELKLLLKDLTNTKEIKELEFTNREKELENLCKNNNDVRYHIVHAPSGFGKTRLLKEMVSHYKEQMDWACLEIELPSSQRVTSEMLQDHIWKALNIDTSERDDLSVKLAAWGKKQKKRLAFFIDDIHNLDLNALKWLWVELIPQFVERLGDDFVKVSLHSYRWFFFSRYMTSDIQKVIKRNSPLKIKPSSLSPFSTKVINETITNLMKNLDGIADDKKAQQLANRLTYATGGHPATMARILLDWADDMFVRDVRKYFDDEKKVWDTIKSTIDEIIAQASLDNELLDAFRKLSAFRLLDEKLVDHLIEKKLLSWPGNGDDLIDQLLDQFFIDFDRLGFYADSITRQILLLQLRHDYTSDFKDLCHVGIKFYYDEYCSSHDEKSAPQMFAERFYQMSQLSLVNTKETEILQYLSGQPLKTELEDFLAEREGSRRRLRAKNLKSVWGEDDELLDMLKRGQHSDLYDEMYDTIDKLINECQ